MFVYLKKSIYIQEMVKSNSAKEESDSSGDVPPAGEGGYRLAVYKGEDLKKVLPLSKSAYEYVKLKHKKHKNTGEGVQEVHKSISKKKKTASSPSPPSSPDQNKSKKKKEDKSEVRSDKPKREITDKQRVALAEGRKKAAILREERKKEKARSGL